MSAPLSIDAYDAQMLDFSSDPDVPMHITGSAEFFAEALMDHDGQFTASTYGEHASVEVDMEAYDIAEYEMAEETAEYHRSQGDEPLDVEVYDASHVPSPLVPPQPLQPSVDVPIESEHSEPTPQTFAEPATLPEVQVEPESEVHAAPLDHQAADAPHVETPASAEGVSSEAVPSESAHPTEAADGLPVSESQEYLGDTARPIEQPPETPAPADAVDEAAPHVPPVTEEHPLNTEAAQHETYEPSSAEEVYDSGLLVQDGKAVEQVPAAEGEVADPLLISDGVYIDPPPAVFLSIANHSRPDFVLFNQPEVDGESIGVPEGKREAYSLLLENQPTLYYEPLSSVFEALRQDEGLLSRVPHSYEGELVLDAYDLQLVASEDNLHSREISLHDLNILHDGSDFVGPLRLRLRAAVPRFIIRFYALQEQIQRLNVAPESGEGEHDQEHHEQYETGEERRVPPQEEVIVTHAVVVPVSLEAPPPPIEAQEPAEEPAGRPESAEDTPQESYEPEDTTVVQETAAEYHEVSGEGTHALEDENDYEGTNTGDEDESTKSESHDADQVHATTTEDTDTAATVTGHGSEFGGEQTEYLDSVQPEEYDERYGEELLDRAGGVSPFQYGEPPHYEEEGEQDTSTAVDETRALPGSDEDEEGRSAATPVAARAVLAPEVSEPVDNETTDVSVLSQQNTSIAVSEELSTSESTNEVIHAEQATGNQEADAAQAKIFSEVDESDSHFVSLLEHEADAEFERTFSAEQNEQEGSIEAILQQETNWDEWNDEDAEGEDEEDWIDPDAASNESSVTLSSKASSKRSHDEVDPSEEVHVEDPDNSPGFKRPRVQ